jgi:hypothetical protein
MNRLTRATALGVVISALPAWATAQKQMPAKETAPKKQTSSPREFGKSYVTLRPEQKRLVDDYVSHYNQTAGSKIAPQTAYDGARLSVRTTFDAVTHALLNAKMTDATGKSLGRAIDLVDAVDEVMGEEAGLGGDRQFRIYFYVKPTAFDTLASSQEFLRERDNTVYHKGFPICFRLRNGPPSIQVSMSRDRRMVDIDVDYRSASFPKALFDGHLTAGNSDVRAGNNLDRHDDRWAGLTGWWRELFGSLGNKSKAPKETASESLGHVPLNPPVKADEGVDKSAHDFLKAWLVDKQPNNAVAYLSRRSYPCLEAVAKKNRKPIPPGMVRLRVMKAMEKFADSTGTVASVDQAFEAAQNWSPELKEAKNSYSAEFRLVSVPSDMGQDEECAVPPDGDASARSSKEKYYATALRARKGDNGNQVMTLLWTKEGAYWKIVAIRIQDSGDAGITPRTAASKTVPAQAKPENIAGDPGAVRDISDFYELWTLGRNTIGAARYASERSYSCMKSPSEAEKKMRPADRIQAGLERALKKMPKGENLSDMMSSIEPGNTLMRPVNQENSKAFAMMAVPDQLADSFQCQPRHSHEKFPELEAADAKYGSYYLSASELNFGDERSTTLLLLWAKEQERWKVVSWSVEVP